MKADHNTIMPLGVKVMSKYKMLSKRECGVIKSRVFREMENPILLYRFTVCYSFLGKLQIWEPGIFTQVYGQSIGNIWVNYCIEKSCCLSLEMMTDKITHIELPICC